MKVILKMWKMNGWSGSTKQYDLTNLSIGDYHEFMERLSKISYKDMLKFKITSILDITKDQETGNYKIGTIILGESN